MLWKLQEEGLMDCGSLQILCTGCGRVHKICQERGTKIREGRYRLMIPFGLKQGQKEKID
jgi:hypothetical protein